MWIIRRAMQLAAAVCGFSQRARAFYYEVVLADYACPECGGRLTMVREGLCRCRSCKKKLDPTITFQRCTGCGGFSELRIRRYRCTKCGREVVSRFLFDGLVFDVKYFRLKMAESRLRKQERRERVRQMLAASRSAHLEPLPTELASVPGLLAALNGLTDQTPERVPSHEPRSQFDLQRYQTHIQAHTGPISLSLEEIPPLHDDRRLDRIWRFIAIIVLAHAGLLDVWQNGRAVMVKQRETDTEGQGVPGELEDADGIEGSLCRAAT
jgi:hypothetical protein